MSEGRVAAIALAISLALHAGVIGYVLWTTSTPDLGFDFQIPMDVEFGMSDAVSVSQGASAPAEVPSPQEASASGEGPGAALDGGVPTDAGPEDAGAPDAGRRRRDAGPPRLAEEEGPGRGAEGEGSGAEGEGNGVSFLPAGSQIALRLDVARVRASPLGPDVRNLLSAMPDWQALLDGSGIDPLDDLDRLLVASPNLQRSRLIAAGRATGDEASIRAAAERLAEADGAEVHWRRMAGVPVADWHGRDETERVVALVGPRHFVIARPEDVARVVAVAHARADRERDDEERPTEHPADALLSMEEGEGLSLEVEGFRNFARARPRRRSPLDMLPVRLRMGLSETPEGAVATRIVGHFESAEQASAAADYWNRAREAYAHNVITNVLGLAPILNRMRVHAEDEGLHADVDIQVAEMRRLINLVRGFFQDRARMQQGAAAPPSPSPPSPGAAPAGARPGRCSPGRCSGDHSAPTATFAVLTSSPRRRAALRQLETSRPLRARGRPNEKRAAHVLDGALLGSRLRESVPVSRLAGRAEPGPSALRLRARQEHHWRTRSFSFLSGVARSFFDAGMSLMIVSPVDGIRTFAFLRAGTLRTLSLSMSGITNSPGPRRPSSRLIIACSPSNTAAICFFVSSVRSASSVMMAALVIRLPVLAMASLLASTSSATTKPPFFWGPAGVGGLYAMPFQG